MRDELTSAERVLIAVERWLPTAEARYAQLGDSLDLTDRILIKAARAHWRSEPARVVDPRSAKHGLHPVEQPGWDPDNPGCAPEACGGSRLDPCSTVMRTRGAAHDGDDSPEEAPAKEQPEVVLTWGQACGGDLAKGDDGSWYPVVKARPGEGPVAGRYWVTLLIGGEERPYPMNPDGVVTLKRGPVGRAMDALSAAGLGPEVIQS
jgi:hypothetical protein